MGKGDPDLYVCHGQTEAASRTIFRETEAIFPACTAMAVPVPAYDGKGELNLYVCVLQTAA